MNNTVWIIIYRELYIESVWSTLELAQAAIHYHVLDSKTHYTEYRIIKRQINETKYDR